MSRIFISHSSADSAFAEEIAARLRAADHHSVFLDFHPEDGIPAGRNWEQELYAQLRSCRAVIALCSERSMESRWCFAEIAYARALGREILPLRIGPCELVPSLEESQVIDMTRDREEGYERLWRGLRAAGLDPRDAFDWDGTRPPYPGLLVFEREDAAVFFGREESLENCFDVLKPLRNFGGPRLVLLLGPSGSGKSSFLRAGLLPRLARLRNSWLITEPFRPLDRPFAELARSLAGARAGAKELTARLQADPLQLEHEARALLTDLNVPSATLLLAIDQFEELLAPGGDAFLRFLATALTPSRLPVIAVGTLRSDFLGAVQDHPALRGLRLTTVALQPMQVDDFRKVIVGPAEVDGIELGPGLTEALLADTKTDDALPLLAYTLRELWERYADDRKLTLEEYREKLGGLEGSVARAAEALFNAHEGVGGAREEDLRDAFLKLVRVNDEGRYARRRARLSELPAVAQPWLRAYCENRLLVPIREEEEEFFEVAHEALFRSWDRLAGWLEEDRVFLLTNQRLVAARAEWERTGRDPGTLLRGAPLAEVERWYGRLAPPERAFVDASRANREAEERRREREVERARDIRRLSDVKKLRDLVVEADALWPAVPERVADCEDWLERARALTEERPEHEHTLASIRERAQPGTRWRFDDPEDEWWHETLNELVRDLAALDDPERGLVAGVDPEHGLGVKRRLQLARTLAERTVTGAEPARQWRAATTAIEAHPTYRGLRLSPQLGLLPIGPDSRSGLWEFAHPVTGRVAGRGHGGELIATEETGLIFVLIPGGTFWMGSQSEDPDGPNYDPDAQPDEAPVHKVRLEPFFLAKYQCTQGQWLRFTGRNPSRYGPGRQFGGEGYTLRNPVEQVTWFDCERVLGRLGLRLPTEAQWEYGARGGTQTPWWTGAAKESLADAANLSDQTYRRRGGPADMPFEEWNDGYALHAPVGSLRANPFGLHDVHGNVWEWCADCYGSYELAAREGDGLRLDTASEARIYRGGCYYRGALSSRSALRRANDPTHQIDYLGVRPAAMVQRP